jgi:hypothetical protein
VGRASSFEKIPACRKDESDASNARRKGIVLPEQQFFKEIAKSKKAEPEDLCVGEASAGAKLSGADLAAVLLLPRRGNVQFGSGVVFGKPVAGNQATNPTPYRLGVVQEASVDFKGDLKKLYGQKQFPVATARGKIDIEGKAKLAVFDAGMLSAICTSA